MLRTTCALLGNYLNKPAEQISIDRINESREDFRAFLQRSKYKEASIRSYLNFARILLKSAKSLGWKPTDSIPEAWRGVLALAAEKKCMTIVKYFARAEKLPRDCYGGGR
jgi:Phage integrase SAM-like domain